MQSLSSQGLKEWWHLETFMCTTSELLHLIIGDYEEKREQFLPMAVQEEGRQRKAAGTPLLQAPITSELGGVAPVFITPGVWTHEDMVHAAQTIWFGATSNAGCNCVTPRAIIMSAEWPQV